MQLKDYESVFMFWDAQSWDFIYWWEHSLGYDGVTGYSEEEKKVDTNEKVTEGWYVSNP